jgi:phosphatidate cytidylyltransferase
LIIGTALVAALVALVWWDSAIEPAGSVLFGCALLLAVACAGELLSMWSRKPACPPRAVVVGGVLLTVGAAGIPLFVLEGTPAWHIGPIGWPLLGLTVGLLLALVVQLSSYRTPGHAAETLALSTLAIVYIGVLLSWMVYLRQVINPDWGLFALLSMIAVVKMSDTGAYFVGRMIGRHKLAPRISPGKTWEGVAGGIVTAVLTSCLLFTWVGPAFSLNDVGRGGGAAWVAYGVLLAVAGLIGDLAESLLKRDAGRKDSSTWLPGLGGMLDILDSLLLASPVAYLCWILRLVGP